MRRQLGRIIQENCYKTAAEMKVALKKKHPDLDVTEQTIRNELSRLGYAAVLPKQVPLLTQKARESIMLCFLMKQPYMSLLELRLALCQVSDSAS